MIAIYRLELIARCPSDRLPDRYDVEIVSKRTILAEDIVAFAKTFDSDEKHLSQEEITVTIARKFAAKVTTRGNHYGVDCEVRA